MRLCMKDKIADYEDESLQLKKLQMVNYELVHMHY